MFNKTDVRPHDFAVEWMQDFEAFQSALASHQGTTDDEGEPTYMNSLMNSMSLVLDEFYKHLTVSVLPRLSPVAFLIGSGLSIGRGCVQCYRCGGEGVLRRARRRGIGPGLTGLIPRRMRRRCPGPAGTPGVRREILHSPGGSSQLDRRCRWILENSIPIA